MVLHCRSLFPRERERHGQGNMPELVFQDCFHPGTHSEIVSFSCPVLMVGGKSGAGISSRGMGCPEVPDDTWFCHGQ